MNSEENLLNGGARSPGLSYADDVQSDLVHIGLHSGVRKNLK